jgi:antitoxin MazE
MKAELIRIGNSRGIRIPKPIIEQCGLENTVELRVVDDQLVVSTPRLLRQGWDKAFQRAGLHNDGLLWESVPMNAFDREEWKW